MKKIPADDVAAWLDEIFTLAAAERYPGQKQALCNRILRALEDVGNIERKQWIDIIPTFFGGRLGRS